MRLASGELSPPGDTVKPVRESRQVCNQVSIMRLSPGGVLDRRQVVQNLALAILALEPPLSLRAQTRQSPLLVPQSMSGTNSDGFVVLTVFITEGALS